VQADLGASPARRPSTRRTIATFTGGSEDLDRRAEVAGLDACLAELDACLAELDAEFGPVPELRRRQHLP